jgi:hypothetical protein
MQHTLGQAAAKTASAGFAVHVAQPRTHLAPFAVNATAATEFNICSSNPCGGLPFAVSSSCVPAPGSASQFNCSCESGYLWTSSNATCTRSKRESAAAAAIQCVWLMLWISGWTNGYNIMYNVPYMFCVSKKLLLRHSN